MAARPRCNAAVQEFAATAWLAPMYAAKAASNSWTLGPVVSHPLRRTSTTAWISSSSMEARWKGRNFVVIWVMHLLLYGATLRTMALSRRQPLHARFAGNRLNSPTNHRSAWTIVGSFPQTRGHSFRVPGPMTDLKSAWRP